jgi:DNA-directed RNA polymerase subunit L
MILKAVEIIKNKMKLLIESLEKDEIDIHASDNTVENCYDVILENEDYTIGNILNAELYTIFYIDLKMLDYIGFKKMHPHDPDSILRLALTDKTKGISTVKTVLKAVMEQSIKKLDSIKGGFDGSRSS